MTEWKARRFWTAARVVEMADGFGIELDGRPVRTPLKAGMVVPSRAMAEAVAAEWDAQTEVIDPQTMPFTRSANAAIDKVAAQRSEVTGMLAAYAETDLLCHRAAGPVELAARQAKGWDPLIAWAADRFDAPLTTTEGILPVAQPGASLAAYWAAVAAFGPFGLTALHDLVTLSGSLILGLGVSESRIDAEQAWSLSRIDEVWQAEQWGEDEEAADAAARKRAAFLHAAGFLALSDGA